MRVASLVKTPAEALVHAVDLGGRAVAPGVPEVIARGLVAEAVPLAVAALPIAGNLAVTLSGGTDGEVYQIMLTASLDDGSARDVPIELAVIAGDWTMPDGGAPMLSVAGFVARVGRDQVLRLTDMGDGRIDTGLVINALIDAQAQAEAYLAGRHALPFATVPTLVTAIVADLARAALYEDELPDNVEKKRAIALKNLDAIRKGDLRLGAEAPPQTAAASDPVRFNSGQLTYPDGLKDYTFR